MVSTVYIRQTSLLPSLWRWTLSSLAIIRACSAPLALQKKVVFVNSSQLENLLLHSLLQSAIFTSLRTFAEQRTARKNCLLLVFMIWLHDFLWFIPLSRGDKKEHTCRARRLRETDFRYRRKSKLLCKDMLNTNRIMQKHINCNYDTETVIYMQNQLQVWSGKALPTEKRWIPWSKKFIVLYSSTSRLLMHMLNSL